MEFGRATLAESGILNFVSERFYKSRKTIFHVRKFFEEQSICLPHTFVLLLVMSVDHVAMFNSSPIQHLRWVFLWQKKN